MPKSNTTLTDKQSKYIELRMDGASKKDAVKLAGYSDSTEYQSIEKAPAVKNALAHAMQTIGIGEKYLAKKIKEGLSSKEYRFFSADGQVTDERVIPDYSVREKYLRTALETLGYIRAGNEINLNLGVVAVSSEKLQDQWNASTESTPPENADANKT